MLCVCVGIQKKTLPVFSFQDTSFQDTLLSYLADTQPAATFRCAFSQGWQTGNTAGLSDWGAQDER